MFGVDYCDTQRYKLTDKFSAFLHAFCNPRLKTIANRQEKQRKIVNIPSYQVKAGDTISVKEGSKKMVVILDALNEVAKAGTAPWISVDVDAQRGTFNALPRREEVTDLADVKEQLVVELYSK